MKKRNEPLGLPRGTVRAILALVVTSPLPALMVLGCFGYGMPTEGLAFYTAILMLVVRDYFGYRQTETQDVPLDEESTYASGAVGR